MYPIGKRLGDILFSALGLILLSPVFLVLAVAVKISSPGPVLFRQTRVGAGKRHFTMWKFRTMRLDAPAETPTHLLRDPYAYITGVGRFLRRTSLDELPQLWHIFTGDMSFVGPRPALWNQHDLITERDKVGANDATPGLTGLAQVRGRDELPIQLKAAYDGQYCETMGFAADWAILWLTLKSVLGGKGLSEGGPAPAPTPTPTSAPTPAPAPAPAPAPTPGLAPTSAPAPAPASAPTPAPASAPAPTPASAHQEPNP